MSKQNDKNASSKRSLVWHYRMPGNTAEWYEIGALREIEVNARQPGDPTVFDALLMESFAHLERFKAQHGHVKVPKGYVNEEGFSLSMWLNNHRHNWAKGKMPPGRIAMVQSIGIEKPRSKSASVPIVRDLKLEDVPRAPCP